MRLLTDARLSPCCGLCERASAVGVQDLLVEKNATWASQQEYSRSHIGISAGTASGVAHAGLDTALVVLVGSASGHLHCVSSPFTKVFSDLQLHTSLGNTPGAIVLTRTLVPANVVANMRLKCVAAALLDA